MIPLVDMHCHLLAGLDDGPKTPEEALAMCRLAYQEGIRMACATAHQNEEWQAVTPDRIRAATRLLAEQLRTEGLPLTVFPCAEVMVSLGTETDWREGRLLSVADHHRYVLMEMPRGAFVDLLPTVEGLVRQGIRPILAHPEQEEEYLEQPERLEELVRAGCLVQVSSKNITDPPRRLDWRQLKSWFRRGLVHVLGSDAHSPRHRRPQMARAYEQLTRWIGPAGADRICSTHGTAILQGLALRPPDPLPRSRRWFFQFW